MSIESTYWLDLGSNQKGLRAHNERIILSILRRHDALSKAQIAQRMGVSAQTITVIMRDLEKEGLIRKGNPIRIKGKVGQPSIPMSLNSEGAYFFGLKIGRRVCDLVLIDFLGQVIERSSNTYDFPCPQNIMSFTTKTMSDICAGLSEQQRSRIYGMGIGLPFELWNWAEHIGADPLEMNAWKEFDIKKSLEQETNLPVSIANDMSAACSAELVFGHTSNLQNFLFYYIGFFIGGGIVLNGSLFTGLLGNAGALGSMSVPTRSGDTAQLIEIASIASLEKLLQQSVHANDKALSIPPEWKIDARILDTWINQASSAIAYSIIASCSVIDFSECIIDGSIPNNVRDKLTQRVSEKLKHLNHNGINLPNVKTGSIGQYGRAIGAASLPLSQQFMSHPSQLSQIS